MNELESQLKQMIINKYGSLKKFSDTINMPWTTLNSILKRGIANSNITNVLKITRELGLDAEKLVDGELSQNVSPPILTVMNIPKRNWRRFASSLHL